MNETSKCFDIRKARGDFDKWLHGDGIDIGCGTDQLKVPNGTVTPWDKRDGDAQYLLGLDDNRFDFVYSSHCLEHMKDVLISLHNWMRVLKPGGFLYIVVPDYQFYEKFCWPSKFNRDHKHSFSTTVKREHVGRQNHWHIEDDLTPRLTTIGANPRNWALEIDGFDFNRGANDQTRGPALSQICIVAEKRTV